MNPILKSLLLPLLLLLTALPVQAEEKSWYEIDGIRVRRGQIRNDIIIYTWKTQYRRNLLSPEIKSGIFHNLNDRSQTMFPFTLTLPETLMTSWSFRSGMLEFEFPTESKDLSPDDDNYERVRISDMTEYWRPSSSDRTSLYNDFFNASDKAFADANSNWALSADLKSSRIYLGYYMGVFIPIGDYHRILKLGAGLGVYYLDILFKLNLCSQYKVTKTDTGTEEYEGVCVGKTEIDSYSGKKLGVSFGHYFTWWERVTKDSVWRLMAINDAWGYEDINFKNHSKSFTMHFNTLAWEIISYTYRF